MGNRLSRIVTRTGDDGTTSLGDGTRIAKDSARIEAIGAVDELNSMIGLLVSLAPARPRGLPPRRPPPPPPPTIGCSTCSTTCSIWARSCRFLA